MNTPGRLLRSTAGAIVLAVLALAWPAQAKADVIDDIAWVLNELEKVNANPLPVKGSDLKASKGLFTCLDKAANDVQVLKCVDTFKDSPIGQKAAGQAGIPSWFWDLLDTYIAFREKDYWGVVAKLGEATICIVAQVLVGGADLCGLIEDLIEIGKGLLDAGKAVAQFVASVGEAAWSAIKSVGCSLGFGGCGGSKTPPETIAYACVFAPRVKPDGLKAIEATEPFALPKLRDSLVSAAKTGVPCPAYAMGKFSTSAAVAAKAGEIFTSAVEGVWTGDILQNVLAARDKKRQAYATAQKVTSLAFAAAAEYGNKKTDPKAFVVKRCAVDDFGAGFGFAHVDRWLIWRALGTSKAQLDAQKVANVTSNDYWCLVDVFNKHIDEFAKHFRAYAQSHYCPAFGQNLACLTIAKHQACTGLMKSVGQAQQCGANTVSLGKEIAVKIDAHFKSKGSKYPCQTILPDGGAPMSNKPVAYSCTRPTQQHFCKERYKALWKAPPDVLVCTPPKLDPGYATKVAMVKSAVTDLHAKYPTVGVDAIDPMMVHAGADSVFGALKKASDETTARARQGDALTFAFLLSGQLTIDGLSRPTIVADFQPPDLLGGMPASIGQHLAPVKPGDPDPFTKPGAGLATPSMMGTVAPSGTLGAPAGGFGAPVKPLSGPLPFPTGGRQSPFASPLPETENAAPGQLPQASPPALRPPQWPSGQAPRAPAVVAPPPAASPEPRTPARRESTLPAVQSPGIAAPRAPAMRDVTLPAVQAPRVPAVTTPRAPAVPAPQAPAAAPAARVAPVQAPPAPARAPSGPGASAPDWGAVGQSTSRLPPPAASTTTRVPPPVAILPAVAAIQRDLAAVSCQPDTGPTRFSCATRAGFERCESMRRQRKVEQCSLVERR